jgi:Septum formation
MYSSARQDAEQPDAIPGPGDGSGTGQRRRFGAIAVVGMVIIGILVAAGASFGIIALVTHGFGKHTIVRYRQAAVFGLRAGQCANIEASGSGVHVLPCAQPHDTEVFATFRLSGQSWPGAASVRQEASGGCAARLGGYINPQLSSILSQYYAYPDQLGWRNGERTVICGVRAASGQLTGSVRKTV